MRTNRRETITLLAGVALPALGMLSGLVPTSTAQAQQQTPNILFILVDNQTRNAGPYSLV